MTPPRFGFIIPPGERDVMLKLGMLAERNGFDSIWIPDHLLDTSYYRPNPECWTMITIMAYSTTRVMVASGVTDPYRRHPSTLAQTVATLDQMFSGRIALGLGGGEAMSLVPFGMDFKDSLARLREATECIKKLWLSTPDEPVSYCGKYYSFNNAFLTTRSVSKPHPPIYLGVFSKKAMELVGELADGWYPLMSTPETFAEDIKVIERGATRAQRKLEQIDCMARVQTAVSKDREKAKEAARKGTRTTLATEPSFVKRLDPKLHMDRSFDVRTILASKDLRASLGRVGMQIPDKTVDMVCAAGTPDDCIESLERYIKKGARHIVVRNTWPDWEEVIGTYGSKIIPYLKQQHK